MKWVWNQPEVSAVLSGMSNMNQVVENVESAGRSSPGALNYEELGINDRVKKRYLELVISDAPVASTVNHVHKASLFPISSRCSMRPTLKT